MYNKLSKDEKKDVRERFKKTVKGGTVLAPLNRLFFEGIFLIGSSIVIAIATIIFNYSKWLYLTAIGILLFGLFFLIGQHILRIKNYNNFVKYMDKKKSNNKKRLTKKK